MGGELDRVLRAVGPWGGGVWVSGRLNYRVVGGVYYTVTLRKNPARNSLTQHSGPYMMTYASLPLRPPFKVLQKPKGYQLSGFRV